MKSPLIARNFGILLIAFSFSVLGWAVVKGTRPYQQAAYTLQNLSQSASLLPSRRPSTYLQNIGETAYTQFCDDGSRLFVRTEKGHITAYETGSWKKIRRWQTDKGQIFSSPDGKRLFVATPRPDRLGHHFAIWDVDSGERLASWSVFSEHALYSRDSPYYPLFGTISPDLSQVILCHFEKNPDSKSKITHLLKALSIADASTGKILRQIPIKSRGGMHISMRWEEQILFVQPHAATPLRFRTSDWQPLPSLPDVALSRLSADGNLLVGAKSSPPSVSHQDSTATPQPLTELVFYDLQNKTTQRVRTDLSDIGAVYPVEGAIVIHGSQRDLFASRNPFRNIVQIRTADGKQVKAEITAQFLRIDDLGKLVAVRRNQDYIDIYRTATGKRLCRLNLTTNPLNGKWETLGQHNWERAILSPDGKWCVVSNQSGLVRIWELPHA